MKNFFWSSLLGVFLLPHSLFANELSSKLWKELNYAAGKNIHKEVEEKNEDEKFLAENMPANSSEKLDKNSMEEDSISTRLAAPVRNSESEDKKPATKPWKTRVRAR